MALHQCRAIFISKLFLNEIIQIVSCTKEIITKNNFIKIALFIYIESVILQNR